MCGRRGGEYNQVALMAGRALLFRSTVFGTHYLLRKKSEEKKYTHFFCKSQAAGIFKSHRKALLLCCIQKRIYDESNILRLK